MPAALGDWWTEVLLRPQKAVFAAYLHLWCVKFLKREATFEKLTFLFFYQPQFLLFFTFSDFISLFFACILFIYTRFENTHEAIVDKGTWELAQSLRQTPRRIDHIGEANPLTGLVYCADCGAKMYNHRSLGKEGTVKFYPYDFFDCSTYALSRQKRLDACRGHYITTKALRTLILETIRAAATQAVKDEEAFVRKVREASDIRQVEAAKGIRRQLNKDRKRHSELDGIIKKLYESYAMERISEERFEALLADYEQEQKTLKQSIAEAEAGLSAFEQDSARVEQFLALTKKYTDFSELTTPMINEFIDKIVVHAPDRSDGDRVQEVDIYLKFIGRFDLPAPELTEEDLKEQERLQKERIRSRRRYERKKEREKLIAAGQMQPGEPYHLSCVFCGKSFDSRTPLAKFCTPNCRKAFYRQEERKRRTPHECHCEICGAAFTPSRKDAKYCSDECRAEGRRIWQRQWYAKRHNLSEKPETPDSANANEKTA